MKIKSIFCRISHPDVFCKKGALKYGNDYRKTPVQEPFFNKKFQDVGLQTVFKKRLMLRFFSVKFLKLFRTVFL